MAQRTSRPTLDRLFDAAQGCTKSRASGNSGAVNLTRRLFLIAGCVCAACFDPAPSFASAPIVKKQAPAFYRLMLGDFEVTVLSDGSNMLPTAKLLRGETAKIEAALMRSFLPDMVETAHNS